MISERDRIRLLMVDDEETVLHVGEQLLQHIGFKVLKAKNGDEALRQYAANPESIDLVILDMIMPGMGGFQVLREKNQDPTIRENFESDLTRTGHQVLYAGSAEEALNALSEDNAFLLKGDVFTQDAIDMWIEYKIENEVNPVKLRPHPHEFLLYYDI